MYCTKQDIKDDFKALAVTSTSIITEDKLDSIISQEHDYIDSYISQRYNLPVPVGATKALNVLKRICIFRVSERVKNIIEVKSNVTQVNSEEKFVENYSRTPNHDLMDIAKGKMQLIGAVLKSSELGISSFTSKNNGNCAKFNVNEQQW